MWNVVKEKHTLKTRKKNVTMGVFLANKRLLFPSWSLMLYETRRIAFLQFCILAI